MKSINEMTRKEFEKLPYNDDWRNEKLKNIRGLVIIPTRRMHDSGYRIIEVIAYGENLEPIKVGGCSDVLNFDGIGGRGKNYETGAEDHGGWNMDCLGKSGLFHIWCEGPIEIGHALSNFQFYGKTRDRDF